MISIIRTLLTVLTCLCFASAHAEYSFSVNGEAAPYIGSDKFAPFYISSLHADKVTQSKGIIFDIGAYDPLSLERKFDFSWGIEVLGGPSSGVDYQKWNHADNGFEDVSRRPASLRLQQLYAEVKWRSLMLSVGMKSRGSAFLNDSLSSGDLVWSGNARAIPEVRLGFVDFQNIPFTNGWVQVDLCISYGRFFDKTWTQNHFNYYDGRISTDNLWTYKRIYLQSKPSKPFNFMFGLQMSGIFGGKTFTYRKGELTKVVDNYHGIKDFFKMILQLSGSDEGYLTGDHKGSWDGAARYRFKSGHSLKAYFQWFWEDGSGLVKNNGFDGLWGLEYKSPRRGWLNGAVVEYLDFTNQSGPLHYDPSDNPGTSITTQVRGKDDYYNSTFYRPYVNYGMTMGTPLVMGTIYNTDGSQWLKATRVRAIHLAVEGAIGPEVDYMIKYNHRKCWGETNSYYLLHPLVADSYFIGASWRPAKLKGLKFGAMIGVDHGNAPSNAFGAILSVSYDRLITLKKH